MFFPAGSILRYGSFRAAAFYEDRRIVLVYVSDIDSDPDGVSSAIAIRDDDSHRVGILFFIIERCACSQLPCGADDAKGCRIYTTQGSRLRYPRLHR